jgi:hypothetical protein
VRNPLLSVPDDSSSYSIVLDGQVARYNSTARAGQYQLSWRDVRDASQSHVLCAGFDNSESNLEPIGDGELEQLFSPLQPAIVHWTSTSSATGEHVAENNREIWRNVITAVVTLAAAETVLAMWVGRER